MTIYNITNGTANDADEVMGNFNIAIWNAIMRSDVDNFLPGEWAEVYSVEEGKSAQVDTGTTTAVFDTNKYKADGEVIISHIIGNYPFMTDHTNNVIGYPLVAETETGASITYRFLIGWDISLAEYTQGFSVTAKENIPHDVTFKIDGTEMYIIGISSDSIHQYTLSSAWDISTATFTRAMDVGLKDNNPQGITFKIDGTEMYIIGISSDSVHQYSLSTAWNISTATFTRSLSVSAKDTAPSGITFKIDGTEMYITGTSSNSVHQYTLSIAWDISTATFTRTLNVSGKETECLGVTFKIDGTEMYIIGISSDSVHQYTLSTAWDISTASFTRTLDVSSESLSPSGLFFKPDGTYMYIMDINGAYVRQYEMFESTSWLSTGTEQATGLTESPTTVEIKLTPKSSSPTAGYPSIYGFAIREQR